MNELLDRLLPANLWAVTGQLLVISGLIFTLFAVISSIDIYLLIVGWMVAGAGIFAGVFCTNKALSNE